MIIITLFFIFLLFFMEFRTFLVSGSGKIYNRPIILTFYRLVKENTSNVKFLLNASQDVVISKSTRSLFFKYYIVGYGMNGVVVRFSKTSRIIDNKIKELENKE